MAILEEHRQNSELLHSAVAGTEAVFAAGGLINSLINNSLNILVANNVEMLSRQQRRFDSLSKSPDNSHILKLIPQGEGKTAPFSGAAFKAFQEEKLTREFQLLASFADFLWPKAAEKLKAEALDKFSEVFGAMLKIETLPNEKANIESLKAELTGLVGRLVKNGRQSLPEDAGILARSAGKGADTFDSLSSGGAKSIDYLAKKDEEFANLLQAVAFSPTRGQNAGALFKKLLLEEERKMSGTWGQKVGLAGGAYVAIQDDLVSAKRGYQQGVYQPGKEEAAGLFQASGDGKIDPVILMKMLAEGADKSPEITINVEAKNDAEEIAQQILDVLTQKMAQGLASSGNVFPGYY